MVHIIIAPDSFKGTATADQAARLIGEGVRSIIRDAEITLAPMADGGEGTAATFDGQTITLPTTDAAGRLTEASYVLDGSTAYIDIAAASGLPAVADHPVPLTGDTYGTGVLIADAQTRGATRIVLCLGGSATSDAGTGILVALGATPLDAEGYSLKKGGGSLGQLASIDTAQLNIPAAAVEWILLTDVDATVPEAATVYAPQKGASAEDVTLLDAALTHAAETLGVDPDTPRFGAAGAVPVGIHWLSTMLHGTDSHIHVLPGAPLVADALGLNESIPQANLVITGEGAFDAQSLTGKVVGTIADIVAGTNATLGIVAGRIDVDPGEDVLTVEMGEPVDVEKQLFDAGARLAADYLRISTAQG
ncbi:MAG: glycerate kinase [Corynebacterium humireducens]|mgnify:FL=1|jgi:glycerate kinase|uniref:Glycerate kinase n=2 Tax=Corynebacterium humireducens TaxID=1223514 RepID=A0A0B5DCM9_9CORY|nr:glycerate kinase [Corynebacterium humireducens]AJE33534.1 glycerate kinase [Corynebacterium humireducens NBRC 106098 = DSM 45392]NLA57032.1 glycerate kinase [Corynebacterium humireducens]